MAGITALFSKKQQAPHLAHLIQHVLGSTFDLSTIQSVRVPLDNASVTLGATFPKHFQRKKAYATKDSHTLLLYCELYNDLMGQDEAEYVLATFAETGFSCLSNLNGPFAFVIWNDHKKELVAVTDRLGRYPLFYFASDDLVGITSDLDACFSAGIYHASILKESLIDLLTIGFPLGDKANFEGVKRLTGGKYLIISSQGIEECRYWQPSFRDGQINVEQLVDTFETCTKRAVEKYPRSTATLSGGWDSRATWSLLGKYKNNVTATTYG